MLAWAKRYQSDHGWQPLALRPGTKEPFAKGWPKQRLTSEQLPQEFKNPAANLGLLLGEAVGDLYDGDIDCDEALALADIFLPPTGAEFGRRSKPRSHRLYKCPGARNGTKPFRDPTKPKNDQKAMLVELRGTGGQSMAPPSVHPDGEAVEWNSEEIEPAEISYPELHRRTAKLAAGALLVRYYPAKGSRNHAAMGLAGALLAGGFSAKEAQEFIGAIARIAGDEEVDNRIATVISTKRRLEAGKPATGNPTCAEFFGDRIWRTARSWLGLSAERGTGKTDRPTIKNVPGDLPEIADAAVTALSDPAKFRIFKQEDRLIELAELDIDTSDGPTRRPAGSIVHRSLSVPRMIDILTQAANWQSFDEKGTLRRTNAPKNIAETILARYSWPSIKELIGVVEAPTLILNTGEILDRPGYHASGLYLAYAGGQLNIPARPTRDDAVKALAILKRPFAQFPFVKTELYEAAYLAALITANLRRQLLLAPAFSFNAPARSFGTGKTLLMDGVAILTTGHDALKMVVPEDDENELRKRLFGLLLGGDAIAALDNIMGPLRSAFISNVLTSKMVKERQLGFSHNPTVRTNMTFLFNGNALMLAGDISTRTVPIELDAKMERPAQRDSFDIPDLRLYLQKHRHELVGAIVTLERAYFEAGAPTHKLPTYGRFEEWTAAVRQPMVWAGCADPYEASNQVIEADPDRLNAEAVLEAWYDFVGSKEFLVRDLIAQLEEPEGVVISRPELRPCMMRSAALFLRAVAPSSQNLWANGARNRKA